MKVLLVFLGGGLGSVARYLVSGLFLRWHPSFPLATLVSNFASCLVLGVVVMLSLQKANLPDYAKLLIITGFCGGFSTYSTFTFETVELFKNQQAGTAIFNIAINFILSVGGLYIGNLIAELF